MPARLLRLPGHGCRYFHTGRCLYEEHRNPGLHEGFRCSVLLRLGRIFDDFTLRAEQLGLSEEEAGRVWQARFPATLAREGYCRDRPAGDTRAFLDCDKAAGDLCLLALPACDGVCPRFARRQDAQPPMPRTDAP
ncbi:MAG: hypothetical protein AAGU21_01450 [Solidesulfovibrio sp.]|uniref:hypothetical protein n=1 Tax=Solidesulfovibrio sp. TaxID=2910990 RepID=UPI003158832C